MDIDDYDDIDGECFFRFPKVSIPLFLHRPTSYINSLFYLISTPLPPNLLLKQ